MVSSLRVHGKFDVGVSANDTVMMGDKEVSLKDIPIVRFKLGSYGQNEVSYIRDLMSKLKYSSAVIEVNDDSNIIEVETLKSMSDIAGILYYVVIDDEKYKSEQFAISQKLSEVMKLSNFEKVVLLDRTETMDMIGADALIKRVAKALKIPVDKVGMCESPMCLSAGGCCLSAIDARDIASKYNFNTDVALHSANHQDMEMCSCVRHFNVISDIAAPVKKVSTRKSNGEGKKSTSSKPKNKVYSYRNLI